MKKLVCTLAVVGLAASVFAQGQVTLNSGGSLVKDSNGTGIAVNGGFVQVLWAASDKPIVAPWNNTYASLGAWLTANPGWAIADNTIKAINGPLAGRFTGIGVTIPSINQINMAIAAWTGTAASFDAAIAANGQVGVSAGFSIKPGNPNATPVPELPASTLGLYPGQSLSTVSAVPEPSSLALAGLGAAALLIFRRRK